MSPRALLVGLGALLLCAGGRDAPPPTLALAGDVSVARGVASANAGAWAQALAGVRAALHADATFGNLESPLTDAPFAGGRFDLRAPPGGVAALRAFTHLGVQNNHAQDGGPAGQVQSRAALRAAGLHPVTRQATDSLLGGRRVAWIAFLDDGRTPLPLTAVRAAARHADVVVAAPHWGEEYGLVTARQRAQARELARAGATLVVGSGPHVLQGTERIGGTLVLYSLGNLLLDQPYPAARIGAVVRVRLNAALSACAVPTRLRAGRAVPASEPERTWALARLGLPACP